VEVKDEVQLADVAEIPVISSTRKWLIEITCVNNMAKSVFAL